jgi:hypothetical protein
MFVVRHFLDYLDYLDYLDNIFWGDCFTSTLKWQMQAIVM